MGEGAKVKEKELKKLSRQELLELLEQQKKENADLVKKAEELEAALKDRKLRIANMGSLADASLVLCGIFEAAEESVAIYKENILQKETKVKKEAEEILSLAREEAARIIAEANEEKRKRETEADAYWGNLQQKLEDFYQSRAGLKELISSIGQKDRS